MNGHAVNRGIRSGRKLPMIWIKMLGVLKVYQGWDYQYVVDINRSDSWVSP